MRDKNDAKNQRYENYIFGAKIQIPISLSFLCGLLLSSSRIARRPQRTAPISDFRGGGPCLDAISKYIFFLNYQEFSEINWSAYSSTPSKQLCFKGKIIVSMVVTGSI